MSLKQREIKFKPRINLNQNSYGAESGGTNKGIPIIYIIDQLIFYLISMFVLLLYVTACKAVLDSWGRNETVQTTGTCTKLHSYHEKFHETVLNTVEAFRTDALISRQLYLHNIRLYKTLSVFPISHTHCIFTFT